MEPAGYDCVFITGEWVTNQTALKKKLVLKQATPVAVFVETQTGDIKAAVDFLSQTVCQDLPLAKHAMTAGPYMFKVFNRQTVRNKAKIKREGPNGSILSQSTFLLCAWYNQPPAPHKPKSTQFLTSNNSNAILDEIADHGPVEAARVVFDLGPAENKPPTKHSGEFDYYFPLHGQDGELRPRKAFIPRTARRSRMFQAFVASAPLSTLVAAKRSLHERVRMSGAVESAPVSKSSECDDEGNNKLIVLSQNSIDLVTAIPIETDATDIRQIYLPMLCKSIRARKKHAQARKAPGGASTDGDCAPTENKRRKTGIAAPKCISLEMRSFLQDQCGIEVPPEGVSRTTVVKAIPAYIKEHGLNKGKTIYPDKALSGLLGVASPGVDFTFFNMQRRFGQHFIEPPAAPQSEDPAAITINKAS